MTSCICNSFSEFKFKLRGYSFYKCTYCKLIFVFPRKDTLNLYKKDYFLGAAHGFGFVNYEVDKKASTKYLERIALDISNMKNQKKVELLDIGSANGFFLEVCKKFNIRGTGLDISKEAVAWGKSLGRDLIASDFYNYKKTKLFDCVSALDVLEHVTDPRKFIKKIKSQCLKIDGFLIINVPNSGSMFAKLSGEKWHAYIPPEHWFYFNKKSLKLLLEQEGFDVIKMKNISKSMTIDYVIQTILNSPQVKGRVKRLISAIYRVTPRILKKQTIYVPLFDNLLVYAKKSRGNFD